MTISNQKDNLFKKDFTMVVVGQIISLFGNNVLRYALPLYLLNITHSASLYGTVMALSFLPLLLLSPVGGLIADRVSKKKIMYVLDFATAALILFYSLTYQHLALVPLLIVVLMILYAIQGTYQPAVQASIPVLLSEDKLMTGNAIINMVNSLSGIIGPVLGGLVFGFYGIKPILFISIICFFISAVMEIFINIPFEKRQNEGSIISIAASDIKESWHFIHHERKEILKVGFLLTLINLFFSALVIVGLPLVITNHLGFDQATGNRLYGYSQGFLAMGGLIGGILSGVVGSKINIKKSGNIILYATLSFLVIGITLLFSNSGFLSFVIITLASSVMMLFSTIFNILMITYVQRKTPETLIGKVMSLLTCLVMIGQPIGQTMYGFLFDALSTKIPFIFLGAFLICIILYVISTRLFSKIEN